MRVSITEETIRACIARQDYASALNGAFSYLNGALGDTRRRNEVLMKKAIRDNLTVFVRAMRGKTEKEMPGGIRSFRMVYNGVLTDLQDILYDMRCNIQHDGTVNVVTLTEREIDLDAARHTVKLPLSIILGLVAIANAIKGAGGKR